MSDEKIHNSGFTTQDVGYETKQLDKREDLDLDKTWRVKHNQTPREDLSDYSDVQGREFEEDRKAVEARQKIKETGELTMADLMGGLGSGMDAVAQDVARDLYDEGVYVIGFFFPVVPQGQARIRTQLSADHDIPVLEKALEAFKRVGDKHGILGLDKKGIIAKFGS